MNLQTKIIIPFAAMLALSGCAEEETRYEEGADVDLNAAPDQEEAAQRSESALSAEIVEQDTELWGARSCAGACGGISPDRSCWCDSGCQRYGDCCSDYRRECVDGSSSDNNKPKKKNKKGTFNLTNYSVSGSSCQYGHKTFITNSLPGGVNDYIQSTYDEFSATPPKGSSSERCRLTVYAKWTPGTRIIIDSAQLSGHADLSGVSRARATIGTSIRSGYTSSTNKSVSLNSPFSDSFDRNWSSSSMKVYSSCSGSGSFTFDMNVRVSGAYREQASAGVDTLSALFRMAKSYEVPGC